MQIPGVSEEAANAIVVQYGTFQSLLQVYLCGQMTEQQKQLVLKDLERQGQSQQKLGPVLSKRVYRVFMSENPYEVIA